MTKFGSFGPENSNKPLETYSYIIKQRKAKLNIINHFQHIYEENIRNGCRIRFRIYKQIPLEVSLKIDRPDSKIW